MKNLKTTISKIIIAILIGMVSFPIARQITDSFDILLTGAWTEWINIFLYPIYLIVFTSIMALLFFSAWNVVNYIFIKAGFIEVEEGFTGKYQFLKRMTDNRSFIGVVGNTIFKTLLTIVVVVAFLLSLLSSLSSDMNRKSNRYYEKSFSTTIYTNDYNDSRIIFYNNELEEASRAFIDANNDYDIFKAFTKKEMSLDCISVALNEHNKSGTFKLLKGFKRNARNKYGYNKVLIEKTRENERSFSKNIDYYRSTIIDPSSIFLRKIMPNRCEEKVAVEKMFSAFIPRYIELTEERGYEYKKMLPTLKNPSYARRKMEHLYDWAEVVCNRYERE